MVDCDNSLKSGQWVKTGQAGERILKKNSIPKKMTAWKIDNFLFTIYLYNFGKKLLMLLLFSNEISFIVTHELSNLHKLLLLVPSSMVVQSEITEKIVGSQALKLQFEPFFNQHE